MAPVMDEVSPDFASELASREYPADDLEIPSPPVENTQTQPPDPETRATSCALWIKSHQEIVAALIISVLAAVGIWLGFYVSQKACVVGQVAPLPTDARVSVDSWGAAVDVSPSGAFRIDGLEPGVHILMVQSCQGPIDRSVELARGENEIEVELPRCSPPSSDPARIPRTVETTAVDAGAAEDLAPRGDAGEPR